MPSNPSVRCSHIGTCVSRRGVQGRIPRSSAYLCDSCGLYYCLTHYHGRPSARPGQYCAHHELYHPTCWALSICDTCGGQACDQDWHSLIQGAINEAATRMRSVSGTWVNASAYTPRRTRQRDDYYRGSMRNVELTFEGVAGSHPLAQGARYIGFEIEAERGGHFTLPSKFGITEDGSLSDHGIEVLTPPSRGEALVENVTTAMETLRGANYEATDHCGLHTHIDLRDRKNDKRFLSRLFAIGFATEDVLYSLQERDRHESDYSTPLRKDYSFYCARGPQSQDFEYIYNKLDKKWTGRAELNRIRSTKWGNRYLGFNFHSVFFRGTLENRIHEGTLEPERILQWADLLQSLVAKAEDRIKFSDLLGIMNAKDRIEKLDNMGKVFGLSDDQMIYLYKYARKQLVEIPFGLTDVPRSTYL